ILNYFALIDLMECYLEGLNKYNQPGIITGACSSSFDNMKFSYGGRMDNFPVIPNGDLQQCLYINGNVVLVPRAIFEKLGNLSANYTHSMGDFDYGLRAIQL